MVVVAALAGCGNDGGSDELTFAEWQERTADVCNEYEPRVQARSEEQPEVASAQDLVDLIDAIAPLNVEYTDALIDVGVPAERAAEVEALYDDLRAQEDLVMEARDAAADSGLAAAAPLLERLDASVEDLNERAQDLGVPACDSR